jgi:DNA-binding response OmpR family regulator
VQIEFYNPLQYREVEKQMRILVIEDEPRMLDLLRRGLQEHDCTVMTAMDGDTGVEIARTCTFDAILLDIGLPRRDGYEVMRALHNHSCTSRVLMLTARDGEDDIIRGLDLGADDYLTKPFSFPELMARLQSITRPRRRETSRRLEAGELAVDLARRTVTRGNTHIDLSPSECKLLIALMQNSGQCVSRQSLMQEVWGMDTEVGQGTLDVLVNSLRGKIDAPYPRKLIHTVRRAGYILERGAQEVEKPQP